MMYKTALANFWKKTKSIFRIIFNARISLVMVIVSFAACFMVEQVTDAIIGFGNFIDPVKFIFFTFVGFTWALQIWYWLRVFYYLEYYEEKVGKAELWLIKYLPRVLGTGALLVISFSFFIQSSRIQSPEQGKETLVMVGTIFLIYAIIFFIAIVLRRKIFKLDENIILNKQQEQDDFLPLKKLPKTTRVLLFVCTGISLILLLLFTFNPYTLPPDLGASISILFACFVIWLPLLYWIHYAVRRLHFPVFAVIFIIVFIFSFFNGNKDVRLLDSKAARDDSLLDYFDKWYKARIAEQGDAEKGKPVPMIMVLSEGGGIRAAYWSACLLGRIQKECPSFSRYVFGIQGVSGGSFGAAIFTGLLKFYKDHPEEIRRAEVTEKIAEEGIYQVKARGIIGEDYLSPVITAMFTRGIIQFLLPFPVDSFDHAKVFEKVWEDNWPSDVTLNGAGDRTFSNGFTSLWENNNDFIIPSLFINITRVENGNPFVISNVKFPGIPGKPGFSGLGLTQDFYDYTNNMDIRISTAALLSARFPYVGPAGIVYKDGDTAGFVDGGYFDNSGANLADSIFKYVRENMERIEQLQKLRDIILLKKIAVLNRLQEVDAFKKIQDRLVTAGLGQLLEDGELAKIRELKEFQDLLEIEEITGILESGETEKILEPEGKEPQQSRFRRLLKPVVIYIRNGHEYTDVKQSGRSLFYQLTVPLNTIFQVRDAFSENSLAKIKEFIRMYDGSFIECSLQKNPEQGAPIPLGWTLSSTVQNQIDKRIESLVYEDKEGYSNELTEIKKLIGQ